MALDKCYKRYRQEAAFFYVYLADRNPEGFWFNLNGGGEMSSRAEGAASCPHFKGSTVPKVLDGVNGTADYLFRASPFRVCIIDIDGKIAYHSGADVTRDTTTLDQYIARVMDELHANGGRVTAAMLEKNNFAEVGKTPWGFWLPTLDYFTPMTPWGFPLAAPDLLTGYTEVEFDVTKATARVPDARGALTDMPVREAEILQRRRLEVVRLFADGEKPSTRPVVLIVTPGISDAMRAAAPSIRALHERYADRAEFNVIYTGKTGEAPVDLAMRAAMVRAWYRTLALPIPCLIDSPENEIGFAYNAPSPRVYVIQRRAGEKAVVYYASKIGLPLKQAIAECGGALETLASEQRTPAKQ